ncbi:MAG: hypothetical protein RR324_08805 [Cellulosilyticaceae bacterium]
MNNKKAIISCMVFVILLGGAIGGHLYKNSSLNTLSKYVSAINNKNYIEAYQMFYSNKQLDKFSGEYVTGYMNEYFTGNELIKLEKGKLISSAVVEQTQQKLVTYKDKYYFQNKTVNAVVGIIEDDEAWKVIFPFKTEALSIYAPSGAKVSVDDKMIRSKGNQDYMKIDLFPGSYTVKMEYPENVKEDYVTEISIPRQTEVYSPYKDYTIEVKAPLYTMVELAGNIVENTEGTVVFQNVIEGDYTLEVYDKNGSLDRYSQKITVEEEKTEFEVQGMSLSQLGYEKISAFTNEFYHDYLDGIKNKETVFFDAYVESKEKDKIVNEYTEWFIDKKNVVDAKVNIEVQQVRLKNSKEVEMKVLEVITLENQEEQDKVNYQIAIKWSNLIDISEDNYKIKERYLTESLVSYQDEMGNWLQY